MVAAASIIIAIELHHLIVARHGRLGHRVAQRIKRLVLGIIVVLMEVALAIAEFDCSFTAFTGVAAAIVAAIAAIASPLNYSTTNRLLLPLAVANACACNGSCQ